MAGLAALSLQALTFSADHPNSVYFSLKRARDNARGVREALTVEVFVNLNETYRELEEAAKRRLVDTPTFRNALGGTHRGILATVGAIEHTLTRQPGWLFLRLGESMERLYRTAAVLRAKLPALIVPEPKVDLPLLHTRWRGLLRGLSSLRGLPAIIRGAPGAARGAALPPLRRPGAPLAPLRHHRGEGVPRHGSPRAATRARPRVSWAASSRS